jgi:hypothetical protein
MMLWLQWLTFAVSLALQIFVIASLRRGAYREYPFVLAYCIVSLVTTVADAVVISDLVSMTAPLQRIFFYRNAALRQFLLFTVVVSLIDRAMLGKPYRERLRVFLMLAVTGTIILSFYMHSDAYKFSLLMTKVTRDLMFGSVGLTLLLWSTLIASKKKDDQLLMITGGLGLQFTLEAIGQSMRQLSQHRPYLLLAGNILLSVAHLMRLYVWREAFRGPRKGNGKGKENKKELGGNSDEFSRQAQIVLESNVR